MNYNSVFLLVLIAIWTVQNTDARTVKKDELKDISAFLNPYENTNFRYVNSAEPRRNSHRYSQKSNPTTTTQRPFVSYWQNIVRNVRVPVPTITWNITNPLATLFNTENEELELPQQNDYYAINNQLRHKTKRRRKHPNKRHRKHKRPIVQTIDEQQLQTELDEENHVHHQQQIIQPQYQIDDKVSDPNGPMYFYDPNTDAYYAVQRVRAMGSYIEGTLYNPRLINSNQQQDENESESDEVVEHEKLTVENMENEQESNENSNEAEVNKETEEKQDTLPAHIDNDEENLRNVLGTFMRDDSYNRQKQRTKLGKTSNSKYKSLKNKPRQQQLNYYFLLDVN